MEKAGRRAEVAGGQISYFFHFLSREPSFLLGTIIVIGVFILIFIAPVVAPYPPEEASGFESLSPPSRQHLFGTDVSGMDVFSRVLYAPRVDVVIGFTATILALAIGCPLGLMAGFLDGRQGLAGVVGEMLLRLSEIFQSFPVFVLALALVSAMGPSAVNVIIGVAIVNIPTFLRLVRSEVLHVRETPFVEAARCVGNSDWRIAFRHILPNTLATALIQASVIVGWGILLAASLSFIGAGVPVPTPEWGSMIAIGAPNMITGQWWPALFPGFALALTVLGFSLFGEGLRVFMDPTKRR